MKLKTFAVVRVATLNEYTWNHEVNHQLKVQIGVQNLATGSWDAATLLLFGAAAVAACKSLVIGKTFMAPSLKREAAAGKCPFGNLHVWK
jgi:hypothetical protein